MDVKQEPLCTQGIIESDAVSELKKENYSQSREPQIIVKHKYGDEVGDKCNVFESGPTEKIENVDEIKQEIIEYEIPKIEHFDHGFTHHYVKGEPEDTSEIKAPDIKQEISEYVPLKNESELLTVHCDLPTLKIENTDYPDYYIEPCYSKQKEKKRTAINVSKKKRRMNQCPVCQKNFHSSKSRSKHIDRHFGKRFVVCKFCGYFMSRIDCFLHNFVHLVKNRTRKQEVIETAAGQQFKCDVCMRKFDQKRYLQRHLRVKGFDFQCYLKKHLVKHDNENTLKCDICSKTFTQKSSLQKHLLLYHNEKPFKCDICSRKFARSSNLRKHLIIHSSETPFKCEICCKEFKRKFSLQQHLLFHSNDKSFKCDICSKQFKHKGSLQNHLVIHSNEKPYKCEICSKGFNQTSTLRHHLVFHNSKKAFKCDICSKEFTLKAGLKRHLNVHNKEKPFKCEICSKSWKQKYNLQKHLKIHEKSV